MDDRTVEVYERRGRQWAAAREPVRRAQARAFARRVADGLPRVDLGCGAGRYTADLGEPVVALDAARSMLQECRNVAAGALLVQGDLESLPFARGALRGAWANMSYLHVASARLPMALAELHGALAVGSPIDVQVLHGDYEGNDLPQDDVGDRFFAAWRPDALTDVFTGAGFDVLGLQVDEDVVRVRGERSRTLADTVARGMRLLVVGLNPSIYAADEGVGYGRPGNRFWPSAIAAGVVTRDRDPIHALTTHRLGMTDIVKRATPGAAALTPGEYRLGMKRVERLAHWLAPRMLCMVGLSGWRAAVDRGAVVGLQRQSLGGRPVYVMPSTSGANAHARAGELVEHLREAARLADQL